MKFSVPGQKPTLSRSRASHRGSIDLAGKKIGLLCNSKRAAPLILNVTERILKERFPTSEISWFRAESFSVSSLEPDNLARFDDWIKGVDAVVAAVGD